MNQSVTFTLSGTNNGWTSGTPFTISAGTVTATNVTGSNAATLTVTMPATPRAITITDGWSGLTVVTSAQPSGSGYDFTKDPTVALCYTRASSFTVSGSQITAVSNASASGLVAPRSPTPAR